MQEQQKRQTNIQQKRREYLKDLRNQLHHTSESDVQSTQDINEKHRINPNQNNVINRYFAISLVKLFVNHSEKITYQNQDVHVNITAKDCDSNQYALLKSLKSIHFIKIVNSKTNFQETTKRVIITPLGQKYIKTYIPKYNRIYNYIKYGESSMNASNHPFVENVGTGRLVPQIIGFVLILILTIFCYILNLNNHIIHYHGNINGLYALYVNLNNMQYHSINALIIIGILINVILLIKIINCFYTHRSAIKYHHYRNENISKDIRRATRKKFVQFLKNNQVKEPDYRFGYDDNLPKISYYLFDNDNGKA